MKKTKYRNTENKCASTSLARRSVNEVMISILLLLGDTEYTEIQTKIVRLTISDFNPAYREKYRPARLKGLNYTIINLSIG